MVKSGHENFNYWILYFRSYTRVRFFAKGRNSFILVQFHKSRLYWWEIDITFYVVWLMEKMGLVKNISKPPRRFLELGRGSAK
ncbi:hypothetical protein BVX98_07005 [bacterium F11]|nr:hypothetical protein BVX98_07005 [bacterium F11]